MQTALTEHLQQTAAGRDAEAILRRCVHCGFCNATCPTYQLTGDELDGPRGRIYLIKQTLEGQAPTASTQQHLDRCLTCRNCETTCPSGVEYGRLVDIGRHLVDQQVPRSGWQTLLRALLRNGLTSRGFGVALRLGQALRPLLPAALKSKVPPRQAAGAWPTATHARKVLLLEGCVQPALAPNIDRATARVLDRLGIQTLRVAAGCCGAIRYHLQDQAGGLDDMRRRIDAWWPHIDQVEAIVINASGCGVMVEDYAHALKEDLVYADKAKRISALAVDIVEMLVREQAALQRLIKPLPVARQRIAFHPPCTLQHGLRLGGKVEALLQALGSEVLLPADSHLCCGSAGTYSLLQPKIATQLREQKLQQLMVWQPQRICSANIGCITHLQSTSKVPVMHWIELVDELLVAAR